MTPTPSTSPNHTWVKKWASPGEGRTLVPAFEKSAREPKVKQKLQKCKGTIQKATFNVRTSNKKGQLPELTSSVIDPNIDIIYIQKHRYVQRKILNITIPAIDGRLSWYLHGKTLSTPR